MTPLVDFGSAQEEYVKAARALAIPSALCVHSWDNLTNKGLIHVRPDRVFVWNHAQVREAETMHGVEREHVVATGAPCYDQWFTRGPSTTREEFCRKVGLPPQKPYLLYLCSSQFIAPREADFVKRWVQALRSAADPRVRESGILVRPHPRNDMSRWKRFDLAEFSDFVLWPGDGDEPGRCGLEERLLRLPLPFDGRRGDQHQRPDRGRDRRAAGLLDPCARVRGDPGRHVALPLSG